MEELNAFKITNKFDKSLSIGLKNGQYLKPIVPFSSEVKLWEVKMCFGNAFFLAATGEYDYREGYAACANWVTLHAWGVNVDKIIAEFFKFP